MKRALMLATVPSMIEQFNMNNIRILQELGYKVDVACNFDDGGTLNQQRVQEFKKELEEQKIEYFNIPFSRNPFNFNNIKAYALTKKLVNSNKYDIVHLHSPIGRCMWQTCLQKNTNEWYFYNIYSTWISFL